MPRFRKKPVEIEANQFFENNWDGWPIGVYRDEGRYMIDTLKGPLSVSEGDWIITGIKGERYPCKPDIFEATYERIEESAATEQVPIYDCAFCEKTFFSHEGRVRHENTCEGTAAEQQCPEPDLDGVWDERD